MPTLNIKGFPEELYKVLGELAKKERRSLKSEVIYLLEQSICLHQKEKISLMELKGLGKEKWKKAKLTKYINEERDSWE